MADFLTEFHIINESDDRLAEIKESCTESQKEFINDIGNAIANFCTREYK